MITTVQEVAGKLPPSVRDYRIYRFVKFECNSTRAAAAEYKLSQTRVRQIITRVVAYLAGSVPHHEDDDRTEIGLVAAERLAREQLEYLYQRALLGFENSQREDLYGNLTPGRVSFLAMAGRLVLWMSKLPLHAPAEFRDDEEDELSDDAECEEEKMPPQLTRESLRQRTRDTIKTMQAEADNLREQARQKVAAESESVRRQAEAKLRQQVAARVAAVAPPNADCSAGAVSSGPSAATASGGDGVTIPTEGTYRTLDEIKAAARRDFLRPAQHAEAPERDTPPSSDAVERARVPAEDADEAEQPSPRPLNRKERRARARRLKRALAKR